MGSAEKSSSKSFVNSLGSLLEDDRLNGAVGLATPKRTGANRALAASQSSSTAILIRPVKIKCKSF